MSDAVDSSGIRFGKIWPIITPWRLLLTGALVSVLVGAGLSLFPPLIMRRLIDEHLVVGRVEDIFTLALIYLGATIAIHLTSFLTAYSTSVAAQGALRRLRVRLFGHLQKLPVSYYDRTPIGDT
ncbi:MAG: ABC transporter ATP-binding protein, partial [Gemmatimonadetes bacterium]|nr:ABC transporter ATP-binding protein [Gemmatimonadota bacterium]